jgi:gamma-glutamylcyclotransferase (GGCT)/AIG2-like uncharacterized protein YtfP
MPQRLFVYGTLAPGRPNAHVLGDVPGSWQPASVRGRLLHEGWGAAQGCPGIVVDETADPVHGHLLTSDALGGEWARLDAFEGEQYERVLAPVQLAGGDTVQAHLYQLKR